MQPSRGKKMVLWPLVDLAQRQDHLCESQLQVTAPSPAERGWGPNTGQFQVAFLSPGALQCCLLVLPFFYYVKVLRGVSKQPMELAC